MNEQIEQLRALVEWQGMSDYTTTRGKTKQILTGIPKSKFWKVWNSSKDSLKRLGLTVKMAGKSGTGETYVRDGVNRERIKKQWEILLWINPHNSHLAESLDCGPSSPF